MNTPQNIKNVKSIVREPSTVMASPGQIPPRRRKVSSTSSSQEVSCICLPSFVFFHCPSFKLIPRTRYSLRCQARAKVEQLLCLEQPFHLLGSASSPGSPTPSSSPGWTMIIDHVKEETGDQADGDMHVMKIVATNLLSQFLTRGQSVHPPWPWPSSDKSYTFYSTGSSDSGVFAELREPKEVYRFALFEKSSLKTFDLGTLSQKIKGVSFDCFPFHKSKSNHNIPFAECLCLELLGWARRPS